jgi:hypothetical protein
MYTRIYIQWLTKIPAVQLEKFHPVVLQCFSFLLFSSTVKSKENGISSQRSYK